MKNVCGCPDFRGFYDRYGYEDWESNLETFFDYFSLTSEQKCLCPNEVGGRAILLGREQS